MMSEPKTPWLGQSPKSGEKGQEKTLPALGVGGKEDVNSSTPKQHRDLSDSTATSHQYGAHTLPHSQELACVFAPKYMLDPGLWCPIGRRGLARSHKV